MEETLVERQEANMKAVTGKLLELNLGIKEVKVSRFPEALTETHLGGYGLGVRLLMKKNRPRYGSIIKAIILIISGKKHYGTTYSAKV